MVSSTKAEYGSRLIAADFADHTNRKLVNHIAWIYNCQVPEQNLIDVYVTRCARAEGVAQLVGRCTLADSPAGELLPAESSSRHDFRPWLIREAA